MRLRRSSEGQGRRAKARALLRAAKARALLRAAKARALCLGPWRRRQGYEAFTTRESTPLLLTHLHKGSKDLSLAGVQGAEPPGLPYT
jgi:hypothetical protein